MPTEGERGPALGGGGFDALEESLSGVGEDGIAAMDEEELAVDTQFGNLNLHQLAALQLIADCESGDECDAVAHGDESLDGIEAGEFDVHVEGRLVLFKKGDDTAAERRDHVMGDEVFGSEIAEGHFLLAREGVARINDEDDGVGVNADGFELRIFGRKGHDAEFDSAAEDVVRDLAGEGALHHDTDVRALAAEGVEDGQ